MAHTNITVQVKIEFVIDGHVFQTIDGIRDFLKESLNFNVFHATTIDPATVKLSPRVREAL